jgi:hypothetical protein
MKNGKQPKLGRGIRLWMWADSVQDHVFNGWIDAPHPLIFRPFRKLSRLSLNYFAVIVTLLSAVCCLLSAVCCLLSAVCCLLSAVCCFIGLRAA